jgi:hypothetical protein
MKAVPQEYQYPVKQANILQELYNLEPKGAVVERSFEIRWNFVFFVLWKIYGTQDVLYTDGVSHTRVADLHILLRQLPTVRQVAATQFSNKEQHTTLLSLLFSNFLGVCAAANRIPSPAQTGRCLELAAQNKERAGQLNNAKALARSDRR